MKRINEYYEPLYDALDQYKRLSEDIDKKERVASYLYRKDNDTTITSELEIKKKKMSAKWSEFFKNTRLFIGGSVTVFVILNALPLNVIISPTMFLLAFAMYYPAVVGKSFFKAIYWSHEYRNLEKNQKEIGILGDNPTFKEAMEYLDEQIAYDQRKKKDLEQYIQEYSPDLEERVHELANDILKEHGILATIDITPKVLGVKYKNVKRDK